MTLMGFRILPLCMPLALVSLHFACAAQTMKRKYLRIILPITDGAVGVILCSFFLIPAWKMNGLYISNVLNGVICFLVVLIAAWIPRKRCPRNLEDLMLIPEGFGAAENDRLDITVREIGQVVSVSAQVIDFCRGRGVDGRRAYLAGLFLEEMAGNVVSHGCSKDNKDHSVDIRVVHKDNDIILRIRDNCRAFDPSERAMITEQRDFGKNVGIRIVYGMAREVTYQNLLGMNVLTVSI